jgi:hypothetical protein
LTAASKFQWFAANVFVSAATVEVEGPRFAFRSNDMKSPSPLVLFFAVFLAIVCGGGLLFGWDYFIREKNAKPYTLPAPVTTESPAESVFERNGMLDGEVFIVTKGGQNYKLGLVSVGLYPLSAVKEYVDQKAKDANAELARLAPLLDSADLLEKSLNVSSGDYYFHDLPQPITATQTNSDGRFQIELPTKGDFVVAAQAHRTVGNWVERYYWLLKISLDGSQSKTIMLSNNNLSSERSPDQLIHTE